MLLKATTRRWPTTSSRRCWRWPGPLAVGWGGRERSADPTRGRCSDCASLDVYFGHRRGSLRRRGSSTRCPARDSSQIRRIVARAGLIPPHARQHARNASGSRRPDSSPTMRRSSRCWRARKAHFAIYYQTVRPYLSRGSSGTAAAPGLPRCASTPTARGSQNPIPPLSVGTQSARTWAPQRGALRAPARLVRRKAYFGAGRATRCRSSSSPSCSTGGGLDLRCFTYSRVP